MLFERGRAYNPGLRAQGGGKGLMSTNAGGVRSMLTRMQIQGFLVSGARLYYRGPEVYLYGYKYSTLGGGFTATLSFRQPAHI